MSRTRAEIRAFLDGQVGKKVPDLNNRSLDGQCVAFVKSLLDFLGVQGAYTPRGNAKDVGNAYVRDGIADNHDGWLRVCVNRSMGGGYGHVWIDLKDETNYEQNGAQALHVTKGTRPIAQTQQIITLDKHVRADAPASGLPAGVVPQEGTYAIEVNGLRVRSTPEIRDDNVVASYNAGEKVNHYQGYIDANGYRWVVYKAKSGNWRYIARRSLDGKQVFGRCY